MAKGGDILEITFNHPTAGSGTILPKADEDSTWSLGGFKIDDDDNAIDGGGNPIIKMTRKRWSLETVVAWEKTPVDNLQQQEDIASSGVPAQYTIQFATGVIYRANGFPVGDIEGNGNSSTFGLKLSGGGKAASQ
jgi:hypothetical protein